MKHGKMFIISGPSGSGKTTLYKEILKKNRKIQRSISVTTRLPRPGEVHGWDYFFVSQKMFEYKKKAGHFLEDEKVFNNYYGTPKKNVLEILAKGKNVLLCIDVKGAKKALKQFPDAATIFVKTPSIEDLKKRLIKRGSEDDKVVKMRLKQAREELKEEKNYKHVLINDNLANAHKRLQIIIENEVSKID